MTGFLPHLPQFFLLAGQMFWYSLRPSHLLGHFDGCFNAVNHVLALEEAFNRAKATKNADVGCVSVARNNLDSATALFVATYPSLGVPFKAKSD